VQAVIWVVRGVFIHNPRHLAALGGVFFRQKMSMNRLKANRDGLLPLCRMNPLA
jgi:hypothetical protein